MFGMGTGVAPPVRPPGTARNAQCKIVNVKFKISHFYFFYSRRAFWRAAQTMPIRSKDDDVKPHDRLVLVSYSPHGPSTPSLSNS